mmetsp:Transcript_14151/g.30724  ORF Transcript_14151/g.30724 Transcript_14151/m.30724 type:complete len:494 (-) Transcript_14151:354-1835(-)
MWTSNGGLALLLMTALQALGSQAWEWPSLTTAAPYSLGLPSRQVESPSDEDIWAGFETTARPAAVPVSAQRTLLNETERPFWFDADPASCVLGKACSDGGIPLERGLCVLTESNNRACWDVCNTHHPSGSYRINMNNMVTMTFKGMVETVRSGLNPSVHCSGMTNGDPCPPGDNCPNSMLARHKVPEGRGICVIDPQAHMSRSCWDMCDTRISMTKLTMGTAAGTEERVRAVRNSDTCPHLSFWKVMLIAVGVIGASASCCGLVMVLRKSAARRGKRSSRANPKELDFDEGAEDEENEYTQPGNGFQDGIMDRSGIPGHDLPPQPPSAAELMMQQQQQQQQQQQMGFYQDGSGYYQGGSYSPTGAGMPIPGLKEPENLLTMTQQALQQQSGMASYQTAIAANTVMSPQQQQQQQQLPPPPFGSLNSMGSMHRGGMAPPMPSFGQLGMPPPQGTMSSGIHQSFSLPQTMPPASMSHSMPAPQYYSMMQPQQRMA